MADAFQTIKTFMKKLQENKVSTQPPHPTNATEGSVPIITIINSKAPHARALIQAPQFSSAVMVLSELTSL